MPALIYGAKGYLGQQFLNLLPNAVASEVDIADTTAVAAELDRVRPDIALNCAGKTGRPNVDWCEDHKAETLAANVTGPLVLLKELAARNVYWVHLGSGCIYQGDNNGKGYSETDPANYFGSFYSRTKAWSDAILQDFPVLNLRLRMPFDGSDNPRNLLTKIAKYSRVLDTENSLTYLPDFFAQQLPLSNGGKLERTIWLILGRYRPFASCNDTQSLWSLGTVLSAWILQICRKWQKLAAVAAYSVLPSWQGRALPYNRLIKPLKRRSEVSLRLGEMLDNFVFLF
jgi:3,5-epimerase/4-reductase